MIDLLCNNIPVIIALWFLLIIFIVWFNKRFWDRIGKGMDYGIQTGRFSGTGPNRSNTPKTK